MMNAKTFQEQLTLLSTWSWTGRLSTAGSSESSEAGQRRENERQEADEQNQQLQLREHEWRATAVVQ